MKSKRKAGTRNNWNTFFKKKKKMIRNNEIKYETDEINKWEGKIKRKVLI